MFFLPTQQFLGTPSCVLIRFPWILLNLTIRQCVHTGDDSSSLHLQNLSVQSMFYIGLSSAFVPKQYRLTFIHCVRSGCNTKDTIGKVNFNIISCDISYIIKVAQLCMTTIKYEKPLSSGSGRLSSNRSGVRILTYDA
jgi:hypothetical protein